MIFFRKFAGNHFQKGPVLIALRDRCSLVNSRTKFSEAMYQNTSKPKAFLQPSKTSQMDSFAKKS